MNKKILVVDDTRACRDILASIFEDRYEIIMAANGRQAIEVLNLQAFSVAVILLDLIMPGMDGFEVLEYINSKGWIESIPVVVVSGSEDEEVQKKCLDAGAKGFIKKPFFAKEASSVIEKILEDNKDKTTL